MTATARLAITMWATLHGIVTLEIEGCYASMRIDPTPLYRHGLGLDPPDSPT